MAQLPFLRYVNAADVNTRLNGTVVRYKNEPVYVEQQGVNRRDRENDLRVDLHDVINKTWIENIHTSDEDLDVSAFPNMGYGNYRGVARYFTRIPNRRTANGVTTTNCCFWTRNPDGSLSSNNVGREVLLNVDFHQMLRGKYPSFEDALKTVSSHQAQSVAVNRKLAIMEDEVGLIKLSYFARPIAVYNDKKDLFMVSERLEHYVPIIKMLGVQNCEAM